MIWGGGQKKCSPPVYNKSFTSRRNKQIAESLNTPSPTRSWVLSSLHPPARRGKPNGTSRREEEVYLTAGTLTKCGVRSLADTGRHSVSGVSDEYGAPVSQLRAVQAPDALSAVRMKHLRLFFEERGCVQRRSAWESRPRVGETCTARTTYLRIVWRIEGYRRSPRSRQLLLRFAHNVESSPAGDSIITRGLV